MLPLGKELKDEWHIRAALPAPSSIHVGKASLQEDG